MGEFGVIDFLRTMLDGMASAQEQTQSPEAHYIIKPFIRSVSAHIEKFAAKQLELVDRVGMLEHALKNVELQAKSHNSFAGDDHPRVIEIENIATSAIKGFKTQSSLELEMLLDNKEAFEKSVVKKAVELLIEKRKKHD